MAHVIVPKSLIGPDFSRCQPLVLDPYLSNRCLLRDVLHGLGCEKVHDYGRLREAIACIENDHPNVMFIDWSKQIDAIEFLRLLRARANPHRFLPVVVMTAYASLDHIATARDNGATEIMVRPWSQQMVESRLRAIVEHPRLFIQGGGFFGPDRRRRRLTFLGDDRRRHENWQAADRRRTDSGIWQGPERRQGHAGFLTLDRRDAPRA